MLSTWGAAIRYLGNRAIVRSIHQSVGINEAHKSGWRGLGPLFTEHMDFHPQSSTAQGLDSSTPPFLAVVLHGLLGAGRNLRGFASELFSSVANASHSTWKVVLVDLRCHGRSAKERFHGPHTLESAARDVISTVNANWPYGGINVLIGHSLGGKVALEITQSLGSSGTSEEDETATAGKTGFLLRPPHQTWTLDSIPGKVPDPPTDTSAEVLKVLTEVSKIPQPLSSRNGLSKHLDAVGLRGVAFQKWLASNLVARSKNEYVFTFDIPGVKDLYNSYRKTEYWDLLQLPPQNCEIHIVKAMRGGRWKGEMSDRLSTVAAQSHGKTVLHEMPHVGHWLHAEDPKGLAALMAPIVARISNPHS